MVRLPLGLLQSEISTSHITPVLELLLGWQSAVFSLGSWVICDPTLGVASLSLKGKASYLLLCAYLKKEANQPHEKAPSPQQNNKLKIPQTVEIVDLDRLEGV